MLLGSWPWQRRAAERSRVETTRSHPYSPVPSRPVSVALAMAVQMLWTSASGLMFATLTKCTCASRVPRCRPFKGDPG